MTQSGRTKLPEDFLYTQNHRVFGISSTTFLTRDLQKKDLSQILDEDEVTRIKTAPTIPPMLQFEPQTPGEVESEEAARTRGESLADKSYAGREAQYFDGIKKLAAKFNRATVLVLMRSSISICSISSSTRTRSSASTPKPSIAGFVNTSANDGDHTHRSTSPRSRQTLQVCEEMIQGGESIYRTSITSSWDHSSKPYNAMRTMLSSTAQLQQPNTQ